MFEPGQCSGGNHLAPKGGGSCPCGMVTRVPAPGIAPQTEAAAIGIARRIAHLTAGQSWPVKPPPGIAVFTGGGPNVQLRQALARLKLSDIRHV